MNYKDAVEVVRILDRYIKEAVTNLYQSNPNNPELDALREQLIQAMSRGPTYIPDSSGQGYGR